MNDYGIYEKLRQELDFTKTSDEQIRYALTRLRSVDEWQRSVFQFADRCRSDSTKCMQTSQYHLKTGIDYYNGYEYSFAIDSFAYAIMSCPLDCDTDTRDRHLSMCYDYMSRALFGANYTESALFWANKSFALCASVRMLTMRVKCLRSLKRYGEALSVIETDSKCWSTSVLMRLYFWCLKISVKCGVKSEASVGPSSPTNRPAVYVSRSCVAKQSPLNGRYYVTDADIPEKTMIMFETPISAIIDANCLTRYCSHCMRNTDYRFTACRYCSDVVFCDQKCALESMSGDHKYECDCWLASAPISPLNSAKETSKINVREYYENFLTLLDHSQHLSLETKTAVLIASINLALCLKYTNAYEFDDNDLTTLTALVYMAQTNTYQIIVNAYGLFASGKHFGSGVVYWGSLFNHSCDPNVEWFWRNGTLCWATNRTVKAGEELCVSYGPRKRVIPIEERQSILQEKYHFVCRCPACEEELRSTRNEAKCLNCMTREDRNEWTPNQYNVFDQKMIDKIRLTSRDHLNRGDYRNAVEVCQLLVTGYEDIRDVISDYDRVNDLVFLAKVYKLYLIRNAVTSVDEWSACLRLHLLLMGVWKLILFAVRRVGVSQFGSRVSHRLLRSIYVSLNNCAQFVRFGKIKIKSLI